MNASKLFVRCQSEAAFAVKGKASVSGEASFGAGMYRDVCVLKLSQLAGMEDDRESMQNRGEGGMSSPAGQSVRRA